MGRAGFGEFVGWLRGLKIFFNFFKNFMMNANLSLLVKL